MCFVGGIGEVNLSADGPNWSRLEKLVRTEGVVHVCSTHLYNVVLNYLYNAVHLYAWDF